MIIAFRVQNFLSIGEEQEISFENCCNQHNENKVISDWNEAVLRNVAIYGPNGSGKTNIILAIAYSLAMMGLYDKSVDIFLKENDNKRLLNNVNHYSENTVSKFEYDIAGPWGTYRYGFEYDSVNKIVVSECLRDSDESWFERTLNQCSSVSGEYTLDCDLSSKLLVKICEEYSDDPLFIIPRKIGYIFSGIVVGTYDFVNCHDDSVLSSNDGFMCDEECIDVLNYVLPRISDIESITLVALEQCSDPQNVFIITDEVHYYNRNKYTVLFKEKGFERLRSYNELSAGMQRILVIILMICSARFCSKLSIRSYNEQVQKYNIGEKIEIDDPPAFVAIDELCYSLHPRIIQDLINILINDDKLGFKNLQLLMTAHDTSLMHNSVLSPEEIYLTQFDGESHYLRLSDFDVMKARSSGTVEHPPALNCRTAYLEGRFGAVPSIGNVRRLR